jgi:hypothetical protein
LNSIIIPILFNAFKDAPKVSLKTLQLINALLVTKLVLPVQDLLLTNVQNALMDISSKKNSLPALINALLDSLLIPPLKLVNNAPLHVKNAHLPTAAPLVLILYSYTPQTIPVIKNVLLDSIQTLLPLPVKLVILNVPGVHLLLMINALLVLKVLSLLTDKFVCPVALKELSVILLQEDVLLAQPSVKFAVVLLLVLNVMLDLI